MSEAGGHCELCGQPVGQTGVEQGQQRYCSAGCLRVATELGTGDGTQTRTEVETSEGTNRSTEQVFLHIDGMHCVTCERFLERVASEQSGVADAAASYVTETIRIDYDPDRIDREELTDALSIVGYTVTPRTELATVADEHERRPDQRQLDDMLGFRYAAGVLFGLFMLFPYIVVLYPAHGAELFGYDSMGIFTGGPGPGDGILLLPLFLITTSVVLFFTGLPLLRGAYVSLVMRRPNTDLLVSLTIVSAYVYGTVAFFAGNMHVYYDLTIVIAAVVVAAIFYESLVKRRAVDRLTDLTVSQVEQVNRLETDGETTETTVSELEPGDRLIVRKGERVPVDGVVQDGVCTVEEAVVTGESLPVRKTAGDELVGGALVTDGAPTIEVGDPPTSSIEGITSTVWDLQSGTHGIQRQSDRVAMRVVPTLVVLACLAGVGAYALGSGLLGATYAILGTIMVFCPWAVGLSTPLSVARSIDAALERGIVIFDETVFERLRETDVIVFDKTGTLTTGEMRILESDGAPELLAAAAKLEQHATHPAGKAIASAVEFEPRTDGGARKHDPSEANSPDEPGLQVRDVTSHSTGIEGLVDGQRVLVGNLALFDEQGWSVPTELQERVRTHRENGNLPVVIGRAGTAEGLLVLGDDPRSEWADTLAQLSDRGIEIVVLTGDEKAPAAAFGAHDAVDHVFAGVPPAGKTETIRRLQDRGHVTMIGDGTNDGPALAAADLGISLGGGTALASEAADITILENDLTAIETAFELAGAARRRLLENTALGLVYNFSTIPLAVAGLLNPLLVMGATVLSVGLVSLNTLRSVLD